MSYASCTAVSMLRSSGSTGPLTVPCITENRAKVATPPLASPRATATSGCTTTFTNAPTDVPPAARTVSMAQWTRPASAPRASRTRSAWRLGEQDAVGVAGGDPEHPRAGRRHLDGNLGQVRREKVEPARCRCVREPQRLDRWGDSLVEAEVVERDVVAVEVRLEDRQVALERLD